tara:strand:- start:5741 stop:6472 length:732 start_codon:yes stop_codon:yes gene_type:complete
MKIYSLITARSGSKGLKNKNIFPINNIPLILYSIYASLNSEYITKTFVSTDSKKYADLCEKNGAIIPFIRPKEISLDDSSDFCVFKHFVEKMNELNDCPELIIHLRPTSPDRPKGLIDKSIKQFLEAEEDYDSARSITEIDNRILKSCFLEDKNILKPLWIPNKSSFLDIWQWQRQDLPKIFKTDGRVDIIKTKNISNNNLHGTKSFGFNTKLPLIDIDTISDINGISEKLRDNLRDYKIMSL